jgi:hypothetical protein
MARENSLPAMRAAADNLAMGKPFEFSMRTMLLAVAMMSVAVMFFAMAARDAYNFNPLLWGLSFIAGRRNRHVCGTADLRRGLWAACWRSRSACFSQSSWSHDDRI